LPLFLKKTRRLFLLILLVCFWIKRQIRDIDIGLYFKKRPKTFDREQKVADVLEKN